MSGRFTLAQARRIALAAQGFGRPRPATVGSRHLADTVGRVAQFQIDSVNVVSRAHYLPLFSRWGDYDRGLLDRAAGSAPRRLFEYWGHEACLIDVRLQPFLRFRMAKVHPWGGVQRIQRERPELVDTVLQAVADRPGGVTARDLDAGPRGAKTHWGWNWSDTKTACEWLFHAGRLAAVRRNGAFERVYDLPERVLPAAILAQPTPTEAESRIELARRALQALGVADAATVAAYFRQRVAPTRAALASLVAAGVTERVTIAGLPGEWFLAAGARIPRSVPGAALVSPFDSLMFERARIERLFGFRYRIEIYVPAAQRQYGYYVYPFLLDGAFAARVDLKAERASGTLVVQSAWIEDGHRPEAVAPRLAGELQHLAGWLGLSDVRARDAGTLAPALAAEL